MHSRLLQKQGHGPQVKSAPPLLGRIAMPAVLQLGALKSQPSRPAFKGRGSGRACLLQSTSRKATQDENTVLRRDDAPLHKSGKSIGKEVRSSLRLEAHSRWASLWRWGPGVLGEGCGGRVFDLSPRIYTASDRANVSRIGTLCYSREKHGEVEILSLSNKFPNAFLVTCLCAWKHLVAYHISF